jgi:hypothetical protein
VEGGLAELVREARDYKRSAYALSMQKTYRSQLRRFLQFCLDYNCSPIPVSQETLVVYVAYLARSLSASYIPNYLNVIRILHLEAGLPNPLEGNFELNMLKRGIKREKGVPPCQKAPITVKILVDMYALLDLSKPSDLSFWAIALIAFFGFLRKSSVLPDSSKFDPKKTILRGDVLKLGLDSFILLLRHSKVVQFGQKVLKLPYVSCELPCLCPVRALLSHFGASPLGVSHPLFNYLAGGRECAMTQSMFVARLKVILSRLGVKANDFSAHSFRRGGASYAFSLGLSPLQIKLRCDWASDSFEKYVFISSGAVTRVARSLAAGVPKQ